MSDAPTERRAVGRGTLIGGRYQLDRVLATGGMARVWTARDQVLDRPVAVKILLDEFVSDSSFITRFRAEALAAARLAHPSVVSVYDTCSHDGVEAIVMELVDGTTLRRRLDDEGRLDPREAARIAARVAEALAVAHGAGIVHRDIKPANVLLAPSGRVVVTDFGIAKASETGDLTHDQLLGTAKYLSPEQVESRTVDGRSDIYTLGVVLYEMVCGRPPFVGDTELTTALARLHTEPDPPRSLRPEISPELDGVLSRTLMRDPAQRWPDAESLARALAAISTGRSLPPESSPPSPVTAPITVGPAPARPATHTARDAFPADHAASPPSAPPLSVAQSAHRAGVPADQVEAPGPAVLVAVLAAVALVAIAALAWRVLRPSGDGAIEANPIAFDPFAGDGENDSSAPLAADGDTGTSWSTERYRSREIYKGGVGLLLDPGKPHSFASLAIDSESTGWAAEIYVLDSEPDAEQDSWGDAVASADDIEGSATFDLGGRSGRFVLVWITQTDADGLVEINEARIEGGS